MREECIKAIIKDTKPKVDYKCALVSGASSQSGESVEITDIGGTSTITKAEVTLEHTYSKNGYDSVWEGGSGKNKLKTTATEETVNGLTFSPNDDGTIDVSGTSSEALTVTSDSEIYSKRVVENGYRLFDEVVGGSVVWNQIAYNFRAPTSRSGLTITAEEDGFTIDGTCTATVGASGWFRLDTADVAKTYGHKLYVSHQLVSGTSSSRNNVYFSLNGSSPITVPLGSAKIVQNVVSGSNARSYYHIVKDVVLTNAKIRLQIVDLTQAFGSSIADYIYNLEQSSSGSGVAFFKKLFNKDYYAYNVGTIMSVCTSQHKMSNGNGFNTYTLSPITLRGIPKLVNNKITYDGDVYKSSGSVQRRYAEVDLGTLTWQTFSSYANLFYANITEKAKSNTYCDVICSKYPSIERNATNIADASNSLADKQVTGFNAPTSTSSWVYIKDTSYTDAATFKTAMSGVKLIYELATPTTESALPFTKPQVCEQGGTEEYVDNEVTQGNRDVSIPVGHNTFYADYIVSDEAKLTTEQTYNVSDNLTVGYRDSSGMHTVTNSLTIPIGGSYEFSAYTGDGASVEPMIYQGTDSSYLPYENLGKFSEYGTARLDVTANGETTSYMTLLDPANYGGSYDFVSGKETRTWKHIASYNGETLPAVWESDRDDYASGTTPSVGAEVCYELATPEEEQYTAQEIELTSGATSTLSSPQGNITVVVNQPLVEE